MSWNKTSKSQRPESGELIVYYFEPFDRVYIGEYAADSDSVFSRNGFTTMMPEVTCWKSYLELYNEVPEDFKKWD